MSIRQLVKEWVRDHELAFMPPLLEDAPCRRHILATPSLIQDVTGPWSSSARARGFGQARGHLDAFSSGERISVRLPPSRNVRAHLALLEEAEDEVWEFRIRYPKPGIRIFGRFVEKDLFFATNVGERRLYKQWADWVPDMETSKRNWRVFFPAYNPHSGTCVDDYVSNAVCI